MALQLPSLNSTDRLGSSSTASKDSTPYFGLCFNKKLLKSRRSLVPEQLRILLINQHSANLLGLLFRPKTSRADSHEAPPDLQEGRVYHPRHLPSSSQLLQVLDRCR